MPQVVQPTPAEDEEEALLKHSEPASAEQILGEAEGERPASPPAGKHGKQAKPEPTLPDSVSVHIESHPQGAVIKLKDRVFGRSPLNLRFRPGIAYELTFVKKGYQNASKRFTVTGRKNQKVRITLKQKRAETSTKKSLLQRISEDRQGDSFSIQTQNPSEAMILTASENAFAAISHLESTENAEVEKEEMGSDRAATLPFRSSSVTSVLLR